MSSIKEFKPSDNASDTAHISKDAMGRARATGRYRDLAPEVAIHVHLTGLVAQESCSPRDVLRRRTQRYGHRDFYHVENLLAIRHLSTNAYWKGISDSGTANQLAIAMRVFRKAVDMQVHEHFRSLALEQLTKKLASANNKSLLLSLVESLHFVTFTEVSIDPDRLSRDMAKTLYEDWPITTYPELFFWLTSPDNVLGLMHDIASTQDCFLNKGSGIYIAVRNLTYGHDATGLIVQGEVEWQCPQITLATSLAPVSSAGSEYNVELVSIMPERHLPENWTVRSTAGSPRWNSMTMSFEGLKPDPVSHRIEAEIVGHLYERFHDGVVFQRSSRYKVVVDLKQYQGPYLGSNVVVQSWDSEDIERLLKPLPHEPSGSTHIHRQAADNDRSDSSVDSPSRSKRGASMPLISAQALDGSQHHYLSPSAKRARLDSPLSNPTTSLPREHPGPALRRSDSMSPLSNSSSASPNSQPTLLPTPSGELDSYQPAESASFASASSSYTSEELIQARIQQNYREFVERSDEVIKHDGEDTKAFEEMFMENEELDWDEEVSAISENIEQMVVAVEPRHAWL